MYDRNHRKLKLHFCIICVPGNIYILGCYSVFYIVWSMSPICASVSVIHCRIGRTRVISGFLMLDWTLAMFFDIHFKLALFLPVRCFLGVGWLCTDLYKSFTQDGHSSTVCPIPLSVSVRKIFDKGRTENNTFSLYLVVLNIIQWKGASVPELVRYMHIL